MTDAGGSVGRAGFVESHGLRDKAGAEAARRVVRLAQEAELEVVRLVFADQHGILRGKTLVIGEFAPSLANGCTITTTLLAKDTAHRSVFPVFSRGAGLGIGAMTGGGDFVMVPDPETFRVLPWAPDTGWILCDLYFPDGEPVPFSTRRICQDAMAAVAERGDEYIAGLEVEFHLFRLEDAKLQPEHSGQPAAPPEVSMIGHGFQYLTEQRIDQYDPMLVVIRRTLAALGLPLRSLEMEFGPGQCELTFEPLPGLGAADAMMLLRSAVKQVCRRNGWHATFMCRPALPNMFSSGWHLHQSLVGRKSGRNLFVPAAGEGPLSATGRHFVAGLLEHARAATIFAAPTINGYKRYRPMSLAPDRCVWGLDNRGAMIRVVGGPDDPATRVENRIGEPAANPYLYIASQVLAGLDGMDRELDPGPPSETPYEADAPALPASLMEAVAALGDSALFRDRLGDRFVDYYLAIKEAEIARFLSTVTDWEQREYFDIF